MNDQMSYECRTKILGVDLLDEAAAIGAAHDFAPRLYGPNRGLPVSFEGLVVVLESVASDGLHRYGPVPARMASSPSRA
jgi:hypothetical protein